MRVTILGCGDAFGSGGRFNTCFLMEAAGRRFLVDCGATALVAMQRLGVDPGGIDAVVLSHLHGDHFGGIPFLLLYDQHVARRETTLTIAGPPGTEGRIRTATETLFPGAGEMETRYPLAFQTLAAGETADVLGLSVTPAEVVHPSGAPSYALRVEADGRGFAYSGDTQWTEKLTEVTRGADLALVECYAYDGKVPYHTSYAALAPHLSDLGARRVVLTHMNADMLAHADEVACETAADGMVFEL